MSQYTAICLWGDSIGKGILYDEARGRYVIYRDNCVSRMARELSIPVENYAVMGCTAPQALSRMNEDTLRPGGLAAIELGGNDCDYDWRAVSENPEAVHAPKTTLEAFAAAIGELVARAIGGKMRPVLLTPPPLNAQRYFEWISRGLNREAILRFLGGDPQRMYRWQERYANAVRDAARRASCKLIDLRDAFLETRAFPDLLCEDGIHPNERGYALICDYIFERLHLEAAPSA